jgi:hypothetical protein
VDQVPQRFVRPPHSSRRDEEEMPGVHGPKAGGRSVHDYSKLFNHLAQYALAQVDTDDKKKDRFMIGLSTKLHERTTLNMGGSFP